MLEQSLLKDLETLGWKVFYEGNSCVLRSDRTTRAGNYHYERRGAIESNLEGYIEIRKENGEMYIGAIVFGAINGKDELEWGRKFRFDADEFERTVYATMPAYLFGSTNIKETRDICKKYS